MKADGNSEPEEYKILPRVIWINEACETIQGNERVGDERAERNEDRLVKIIWFIVFNVSGRVAKAKQFDFMNFYSGEETEKSMT